MTPTLASLPSSLYRPSSSDPTASAPLLCTRYPATTQSAVRSCLILNMVRLSGWYVPSSGLATMPSSPAPSNWLNQTSASPESVVAGVRYTGGSASASASSSASRRTENGSSVKSLPPSASRSNATNAAGVDLASIGATGGITGRSMAPSCPLPPPQVRATTGLTASRGGRRTVGARMGGDMLTLVRRLRPWLAAAGGALAVGVLVPPAGTAARQYVFAQAASARPRPRHGGRPAGRGRPALRDCRAVFRSRRLFFADHLAARLRRSGRRVARGSARRSRAAAPAARLAASVKLNAPTGW